MNDIRRYINILENTSQDELQKYRDELKYWQNEQKKYWPVSRELMAQYNDGSHTKEDWDGSLIWKKDGKLHRDGDKPAVIWPDGDLEWYQNGKLHRDGDKPAWIWADGKLEWWQNGLRHRDGDKPAYISADGSLNWYQNDKLHRFGSPAIIYSNGIYDWYWRGRQIPVNSQEEFIEYMKKHKGLQRFRVNKS